MSKAKTAKHVDRATPVLRTPRKTDADKVQATRTASQAMQASPDWAQAVEVQGAVTAWNKVADDMQANVAAVGAAKEVLFQAEAKARVLRRKWQAATDHVLSTVNVFADGSGDVVKGFSLGVRGRTATGAQLAPEGLSVAPDKAPGSVVAKWKRGTGTHGFIAQHATDPANPATYSAIVPCTASKCRLEGQLSGAVVHFRVAAIDPTEASGQSPWTAWVAGTAT